MKKIKKFLFPLLSSACLCSCTYTASQYSPALVIVAPEKTKKDIIFYQAPPLKSAIKIGTVMVNGNDYADHKHVIEGAKKKAAKVGGDFILLEDSGIESKTVVNPGYSKYNETNSWDKASGESNTNAYSEGPSTSTTDRPWGVFTVWAYTPSQLGVKTDQWIITGFHIDSEAESSKLQIGDAIIGIDGYDVSDEKVLHHLLKIQPGNPVKISVMRNNKRLDYTVRAIPN